MFLPFAELLDDPLLELDPPLLELPQALTANAAAARLAPSANLQRAGARD
jgi:hypothetical protein